jgi:hypothetical protein
LNLELIESLRAAPQPLLPASPSRGVEQHC